MYLYGDNSGSKKCSFCGKSEEQVDRILPGATASICNECIDLCNSILEEDFDFNERRRKDGISLRKPKEITEILDQYVIGQEKAKKALAVSVYNHYKRIESNEKLARATSRKKAKKDVDKNVEDVEIQKSNILLIGPTGSGKTYLAQCLAKILN